MPPSISEPSPEPVSTPDRRQWPADYYASATPDPVLPRGVSYGCGALSVVVLLVVFLGGAYVSKEGLGKVMDMGLGMSLGDMRRALAPEVTAEQKATLEREVEAMREQLRTNGIPAGKAQPFVQALDKAMRDDKITPAEVEQLTKLARDAVRKRP